MGMTMGYALDTPDIQVTVNSNNIHLQNLTAQRTVCQQPFIHTWQAPSMRQDGSY